MIVRSKQKSRGFYMLENSLANDPGISWAAKGMLVFLLAKPDDWRVCVEALVNFTKPAEPRNDGKAAVYATIKELVAAGYMTKHKHQDGTLDYMVYDERQAEESADSENRILGKSQTAETAECEKPDLGFRPLVKTVGVVKTVKASTKTKGAGAHVLPDWIDPALWSEFEAHRKEKKKPITAGSAKRIIADLGKLRDAGQDVSAVINQTISNGWTGVFAVNTNTTSGVAKVSRHNLQSMNYDAPAPDGKLPF